MTRRRGRGAPGRRRSSEHRETWLSGGPPSPRRFSAALSVALCYPADYSLGMSNLGFQTALGLFNEQPGVFCDRVFLELDPPFRVRSRDTRMRLSSFDVVAFSVSYENDYLNMVSMLDASGIPLSASERSDEDPLVVMGGVCAYLNPEPVADFLDAVLVGEAGALVGPFVQEVTGSSELPRDARLRRLARLPGVYVPALYTVDRDGEGRITGFQAEAGAPFPVRPASGQADMPVSTVLSDGAFFSDMFLLETSRGCARGCRFCAAGSVLKPRAAHSAAAVLEAIEEASDSTDRVGLVTAALLDHPEAQAILEGALKLGVEVNVSSLRADRVTPETARLLVECGVRTVTLAPETGREDLRRVIGKPLSDEALMSSAGVLAEAGIRTLKLYFMVGLPGERWDDIDAIPELARELRRRFVSGRSGARVTVSASAFVPKPRTAFQWLPMVDEAYLRGAMMRLRRALARRPVLEFTGTGPREARREGVLARGGRELAEALRLAAVEDTPTKAAFRRSGVDVGSVLDRERPDDEVFPWEIIELGSERAALLASLRTARELIAARR